MILKLGNVFYIYCTYINFSRCSQEQGIFQENYYYFLIGKFALFIRRYFPTLYWPYFLENNSGIFPGKKKEIKLLSRDCFLHYFIAVNLYYANWRILVRIFYLNSVFKKALLLSPTHFESFRYQYCSFWRAVCGDVLKFLPCPCKK